VPTVAELVNRIVADAEAAIDRLVGCAGTPGQRTVVLACEHLVLP